MSRSFMTLAGLGALALLGCAEPGAGSDPARQEAMVAGSEIEDADRLVQSWRWSRRIVLATGSESDLSRQATLVGGAWDGWRDRDLELVLLTNGGGLVVERFVDGGPVGRTFDVSVETALEAHFGLDPDAAGCQVVLVGKDGGVKARWNEPIAPVAVFDLVDAMPMRIQEMRENQ